MLQVYITPMDQTLLDYQKFKLKWTVFNDLWFLIGAVIFREYFLTVCCCLCLWALSVSWHHCLHASVLIILLDPPSIFYSIYLFLGLLLFISFFYFPICYKKLILKYNNYNWVYKVYYWLCSKKIHIQNLILKYF